MQQLRLTATTLNRKNEPARDEVACFTPPFLNTKVNVVPNCPPAAREPVGDPMGIQGSMSYPTFPAKLP
jgi:hypothetical protein